MSKVKLSQNEISRILEALPDTYYRTDNKGIVQFLSSSVENIFGFKPEEVIGKPITNFYADPEDRKSFLETLDKKNGRLSGFETRMQHKTGNHIWVSTSAWYIKDEDGNISGVEGLTREITKSKHLKQMLIETSESYRKLYEEHLNILEYSPGGILKLDRNMKITFMNPAMEDILGVPKGQRSSAIGENIMGIYTVKNAGFIPLLTKVAGGEEVSAEGAFESLYGKSSYISIKGVPFIKHNEFDGAVFLVTDITQLKEMSDSLNYQASHDPLTGLMNRREFEKRLTQAMDISRLENVDHVLCYVDLDQFKIVNDTCGHMAGDDLLRQLSPLLEENAGKENLLARLGGDEFGVIYYNKSVPEAMLLAENLLAVVRDFRFHRNEKLFEIGCSIGLVAITPESQSISDLLSAADSACYIAKETGRNRIQLYTKNDNALKNQKNHMQWFQRLNHAIEHNQFVIYFQPINMVNLNLSYNVVGEFLVRMLEDDNTIINPTVFIPSAERYQLMNKIDRFVIESVFSLLALKPAKNISESQNSNTEQLPSIQQRIESLRKVYTINLSLQSVSAPDFSEFVEAAFQKYGISPESICFEITETAVVTNITEVIKFINRLKKLGCLFALDDFGSGMSSLAHLKKLPVDIVKIDGSFVMSMNQNQADLVMIKSVVEISRVMHLHTIAEYVEDEATAEKLKSLGVDYTQGFFHGIPAEAEDNKLLG